MANEHAKEELSQLLSSFDKQVQTIAEIQQRRVRLTAAGTAAGKRVTVTVNADGTVIDTRFGPDAYDLNPAELGRAVTEAAQRATAELARRTAELMRPLTAERARLPKMSDLIEGLPDLTERMPVTPPPSTAPPNDPERLAQAGDSDLRFTDVEEVDFDGSRRNITDSSW
ncbi:DNA-binding protein YbaB [Nocardia transvalensis]|uniref:DNA-binding protein YbaB n=1 Tax=Nocardia transvalensis TaxID=37333 RepID=A0A7W9PB96_9NOCA|nr:YbaB/EbfC family nucleoid-associated protein [Nocardia transvalensis]MBB5912897.1 DNA-binding protein YbaB [Nocardia transvalensis]